VVSEQKVGIEKYQIVFRKKIFDTSNCNIIIIIFFGGVMNDSSMV